MQRSEVCHSWEEDEDGACGITVRYEWCLDRIEVEMGYISSESRRDALLVEGSPDAEYVYILLDFPKWTGRMKAPCEDTRDREVV